MASRLRLGQAGIEPAQHVVGAKLEDDQVGFPLEAVERPAEPRLACFAGVARNAAVDDRRGDAMTAQRRLQLRRKAEPLIEAIAGGQAVAEREHQRPLGRRARAGQADRQKGGGNRPADHAAEGGAIVAAEQAP